MEKTQAARTSTLPWLSIWFNEWVLQNKLILWVSKRGISIFDDEPIVRYKQKTVKYDNGKNIKDSLERRAEHTYLSTSPLDIVNIFQRVINTLRKQTLKPKWKSMIYDCLINILISFCVSLFFVRTQYSSYFTYNNIEMPNKFDISEGYNWTLYQMTILRIQFEAAKRE